MAASPFSRQPEQRYNTLDFASKIVCQKGYPSLDSPSFSVRPVYTQRISAYDRQLAQNARSPDISSSQWMKCQNFSRNMETLNTLIVGFVWGDGQNHIAQILIEPLLYSQHV